MAIEAVETSDDAVPEHISVPDQFTVNDAGTANWVVRKIVEARSYADRVEEWAAGELRRARHEEAWFTAMYGSQVERWVRGELVARGGRARSVKLPAGQVGLRTTPVTFRTVDAASLASWCRQRLPAVLKVRVDAQGQAASSLLNLLLAHKLDATIEDGVVASELKRHVTSTGELPPGVEIVDEQEKFYIR